MKHLQNQSDSQILPMFNITNVFFLKEIVQLKQESNCSLYLKNEGSFKLTQKKQVYSVVLSIHDEYVVEYCPKLNKTISAFKCDYHHQFQIIRKPALEMGRVGQPMGIRICLKNSIKFIELLAKPESKNNLQHFAQTLTQKYIVQLGFHQLFKALKKIGKGMTACVYNAQCFATKKEVAIKCFKRAVYFAAQNNNGEISFKKQFKFLTQLKHKNICKFQGVYETENSTYVIMELLPLSLFGYLKKFGFPSEDKAKIIMKSLLQGINYLHQKGIMHRDLKLENIMVKKDLEHTEEIIPVIVDFGLAQYYNQEQYLYVRCGTPGYVAPEVLNIKTNANVKTYTCKVDIFSLAVVYYIILFQKPLFQGTQLEEVVKKNHACEIDFQSENFKLLSQEGRDLFKMMLAKDPANRISADEALKHPYFTGEKLVQKVSIQKIIGDTNDTIPAVTQQVAGSSQQK